ncbi:FGGY-family carbohydrate kinase [Anabaena sp. FACHB-709]|uniref:D-ribulose kinase n=2 Tax=Nostocaceae TaxID=1162 RepID=A0A1Z4KMT4_ANAVA|nr:MULTISPECIES: FGGY-family carbohydrate kinase [Nostocaceae]BAY70269.1 putative sugar kinase, FGGY family protein [Trichormus variabilis NIES-23]HBW30658.1 carbohydrate kinase [Nostoc sp. UBA8866]MBD2173436.1 FGGY-family carbohydrate kinase [Anabaena cylindrica FACHB-318]MBD2265255.1 FGGY-family carbohydrate kinase [Anabaena sp. FACHB-709]MBD2274497.1 FGGY-family carbohydrate kinase [Nostoc sp. PCC 7120 = FACHB-418]
MDFYLGIDFGTSGARAVVIDESAHIQVQVRYPWLEVDSLVSSWQKALLTLLGQIPEQLRREIRAIAINGTSSTVLLCDVNGNPVDTPLLYNDGRGSLVLEELRDIAPANHTVLSATSSLAKLRWMMQLPSFGEARYFLHQADWLGFLLHGQLGISDYHNALKLGYDVEKLKYPEWLESLQTPIQLPKVLPPGTPIGEVRPEISQQFLFPDDCVVCAGTTDSIAAFLASGAKSPGEAVTSLGSTLVLKLLSHTRVEDARYGIYSHRLGDLWLTGGASNTGGAVLREFFTDAELENLSREINATKASQLDYYPLLKVGERFPINDSNLPPRLTPRPDNPAEFLHGLLESIARIEAQGYELLQKLGADSLNQVYTAGGGAKNPTWAAIRQRNLKVPVISSLNTEAAYGTALLAMQRIRE